MGSLTIGNDQERALKLTNLIAEIPNARVVGDADVDVSGVVLDSRAVRSGAMFVALRGTRVNGHEHVEDAIARGAVAVVTERPLDVDVTQVVVKNSAKALALIAAAFYGKPADSLRLCGTTGTDGKTSVTHCVRSILDRSAQGRVGIIGTLGHGVDELVKTPHTTPDAITLHRLFREMLDSGCFGVAMEVSSHAVRQHRTWGLNFEVGIVTNVTHDHLDYHSDFADYRAAKTEFCHSLADPSRADAGTLIYWQDDPVAREIGESFPARAVAVGKGDGADVTVCDISATLSGTRFTLDVHGKRLALSMTLLGDFVPTNASLAAAAAMEMGADHAAVERGLSRLTSVPGRFEALGGGDLPVVIVDYCHTPDAMTRMLATCRRLGPNRIISVFGCGGDRDRDKRPLMGAAAEKASDVVILTTDNPRNESAADIIDDIRAGMRSSGDVVVELDRERAIAKAVAAAGPNDLVALMGKGAETAQVIGDKEIPYSEHDAANRALDAWRKR